MAGSTLNPNAKEWNPAVDSPEEKRSLYMTFSNGFPLSELQIHRFFVSRGFGAYIQNIDIHQPRDSAYPLFGKITFKYSCVPLFILNGQEQVRLCINGRTVWCKKYRRANAVA